ncbi:hypothetical protein ACFWJ5_42320 [Streptomyces qaidamensis]|uniref:hypothetical protein n=1 Tax=Streptomyces qaidamensis TaxID=1783515 RepID=UPI003665ABD4
MMAAPTALRTSTWTDFAMRPNLSSPEGIIPSSGPVCDCPDIIVSADPIDHPHQTLSTPESWHSQNAGTVYEGRPTYIYVRAKNFYDGSETGDVSLYYAPAELIQWPSQWKQNRLRPQEAGDTVALRAHKRGGIAVGDNPFYWEAPPPSPNGHYCLFALVNTAHTKNPLPDNVPTSYKGMADLVSNYLNIGWKNTAEVESDVPTWTRQSGLTVPDTCPLNQRLMLSIIGSSGTVGGAVALSSSDTQFEPLIDLPETTIVDANRPISFLTQPKRPTHATLNLTFWQHSSNPGLQDSIQLVASWIPPDHESAAPYVDKGIAQRTATIDGDVFWTVPLGAMNYMFRR